MLPFIASVPPLPLEALLPVNIDAPRRTLAKFLRTGCPSNKRELWKGREAAGFTNLQAFAG